MSKREDDLSNFLSDDEKKVQEEYRKKYKAIRDKAVKRRKAEMEFWRQVRVRRDEVARYLAELQTEDGMQQQSAEPITPPTELPTEMFDDSEDLWSEKDIEAMRH